MSKKDYNQSVIIHKKLGGLLELTPKIKIKNKYDLSLAYTPGVAQVCKEIAAKKEKVYELTSKKSTIAIVSDGSAVLGIGNIGPEAALPVMEGKAILFKIFGNVNAVPLCINTQKSSEIISFVKNIAPTFAGINLEDISAPRCFEIEEKLKNIGIPVFHDDQHGTAIVVLAALINALKVAKKEFGDIKIVINGAGAAGISIAKILRCENYKSDRCLKVNDIIVCDSKGIISRNRKYNNIWKEKLSKITNKKNMDGTLEDAIKGADVFIGVSVGNVLNKSMIKSMNKKPIIFAMANPDPEIMPEKAYKFGAYIVGTGMSNYPNQINNLLVFPGIFKGALDAKISKITSDMELAAAHAIANFIKNPNRKRIIPSPLTRGVAEKVAEAIKKTAKL